MASEFGMSVEDVIVLAHRLRDYAVQRPSDTLADSTVHQFLAAFSQRRDSMLRGRHGALEKAQTRRKLTPTESAEMRALESVFYPATPRSRSRKGRGKSQQSASGNQAPKTDQTNPRRRQSSLRGDPGVGKTKLGPAQGTLYPSNERPDPSGGAEASEESSCRPGAEYDIHPWHNGAVYLMGHPGSGRRR